MKTMMYRQGDVLLVAIAALPEGAKLVKNEKEVVLAHGEATGHAHVMDAAAVEEYKTAQPAPVHDLACERFLKVMLETTLRHEKGGQPTGEHDTQHIAPGIYGLVPQCEWSYDQPRRVTD